MKQYGLIYKNNDEMRFFIEGQNLNRYKNVLVQIFTGINKIELINNMIEQLTILLPQAEIIGTTVAGEIYEGTIYTESTIVAFTVFDQATVKTVLLHNDDDEFQLGKSVVEKLVCEETKAIILFLDGLLIMGEGTLQGIQSANSNIIVCGGKAGDNGYFRETFVFTKDGITQKGVAAASLSGKGLEVTTEYSFCWSPIGKIMTVTEADGNKICTIDHVKAFDIYKKYLGDEVAKELPMSATEFPLILN